jgi:hypothetical protein
MNGQNIVQLHDGAVLAFEGIRRSNWSAVIFCHGWPSSRTMAQLRRLNQRVPSGVRIHFTGPARASAAPSMQLDRKLSDWPSLVEQLVDNLEIGEFRILAIFRRRALRVCDGDLDARPSARDRYRRRSDSICRTEGLQRITAALSHMLAFYRHPAATVAAIVSPGATVFVVPRADPASSAAT